MVANNSPLNTIAQTSLQNQGSSNKDNIENIISVCTEAYCSSKTFRLYELSNDENKICNDIISELLKSIKTDVINENAVRKQSQIPVIKHVEKLNGYIAAMIVPSTDEIRMLSDSNGNPDVLIVKDYYWNPNSRSWKWSGIWKVVEDDDKLSVLGPAFRNLCLSGTLSEREIYYGHLKKAPRANAWVDNNKVFLRNGLWNYETRIFTDYDDPIYGSKYADLIVLMLLVDELDDEKKLSQFIRLAYAMVVKKHLDQQIRKPLCCKIMEVLARAQACMFRSIYGRPFSCASSPFLLQQCNEIPMFAEKNTSVNPHNIYIHSERCLMI